MSTELARLQGNRLAHFAHDWHRSLPLSSSKTRLAFLWSVLAFVCAGTVAAFALPIGGAILAQGRLIAEGKNRTVEHLEGGIVTEVFVKEGDRVSTGQLLARIDVTTADAKLASAEMQRDVALLKLTRYISEQQGRDVIEFPPDIVAKAKTSPDLAGAIQTQVQEFQAKRAELTGLRFILNNRLTTNQEFARSLQIILDDRRQRISSIEEEVRISEELLRKGLTTRDKTYTLRRQHALDQDQIKNTLIQIDEKESLIAETRQQLNRLESQREKEITDELLKLQAAVFELNETIKSVSNVTTRSEVRAPETGVIVKVKANTKNQVVKAGDVLFEIFPDGLPLTVEVPLEPHYIETVFLGQDVMIRFPSRERANSLRSLDGKVTYISNDSRQDERTGRFHFIVRTSVDRASVESYGQVAPGNIAEVYFRLKDQNFFMYLIEPLRDLSRKAFVG